jgi:hypothetical protein
VLHDGRSADVKLRRQGVDPLALCVELDESLHFVSSEAMLDLAERSGSSSGWVVALLTSENALKRGHVVVVGVTAHQLHRANRLVRALCDGQRVFSSATSFSQERSSHTKLKRRDKAFRASAIS